MRSCAELKRILELWEEGHYKEGDFTNHGHSQTHGY